MMYKGVGQGANHLVAVSPTYPRAYWAKPEPNYAWKVFKDLGVNCMQVTGGQEGNVLKIQMNENHPYGKAYNPDWAQNLEAFLAKADSYGIKVVFHAMGSIYGTSLGIVAPMMNYRRVDPYTPIEQALALIDKLGGNNVLGKNFLADPRVAWWCPINEARLDYADVRDWVVAVLRRIKEHGGKASVCVNDGLHRYPDTFPYIIPIIGDYVDYLQAHIYTAEEIHEITREGPTGDMYAKVYPTFLRDFESMVDGRGGFSVDRLMLTEFGCGNGTWVWHAGTDTTTVHQQAEYIRAAFDAAKSVQAGRFPISNLFYWEPINIRTDIRTFGFIEYDGTINEEPYTTFKTGMPMPTPLAIPLVPIAAGVGTYLLTKNAGYAVGAFFLATILTRREGVK